MNTGRVGGKRLDKVLYLVRLAWFLRPRLLHHSYFDKSCATDSSESVTMVGCVRVGNRMSCFGLWLLL